MPAMVRLHPLIKMQDNVAKTAELTRLWCPESCYGHNVKVSHVFQALSCKQIQIPQAKYKTTGIGILIHQARNTEWRLSRR